MGVERHEPAGAERLRVGDRLHVRRRRHGPADVGRLEREPHRLGREQRPREPDVPGVRVEPGRARRTGQRVRVGVVLLARASSPATPPRGRQRRGTTGARPRPSSRTGARSRPAAGSFESVASPASPAAFAAWAAGRRSPVTQPTTAKPRSCAADTTGASARRCSSSTLEPLPQVTTRQFTGVPARRCTLSGRHHSRRTSASRAEKPSRRFSRSMSAGPHGQRIGIQVRVSRVLSSRE